MLMKNISSFRFLVIIILTISVNTSVYCQKLPGERANTFSLGVSFGTVFGQAKELVYPTTDTKGELLSELLWDMKPLFYFNLQAEFGRTNPLSALGFYSSLSFKMGLPGDSGILQDRDWMSIENNGLTHFSEHTNKTGSFYWLDAKIGLSIPVKSFFYLKPFINGSWMYFSFSGRDGYGTYARYKGCAPDCEINKHSPLCKRDFSDIYYPIDDNPYLHSFEGEEVIRYHQHWLLIAPGISIGTNIFYPLSFELSFQISPFTYCAAVDNHIGRSAFFNDYTAWGIFLEPKGIISYSIGRFDLSLEAAYRYIGKTKGKTFINNSSFPVENESGAGLGLLDARIFVKFRI